MKLNTRCFPVFELPYENLDSATRMMAKLYNSCPFLPSLPKLEPEDLISSRSLSNIPGVRYRDKKFYLRTTSEAYKTDSQLLDETYNHQKVKNLNKYGIDVAFLEKYCLLLKKFSPSNAYVNFLGPFSLLQTISSNETDQMIVDKNYRKLFIQSVCVKVLWAINKIKENSPETTPIVILEEPYLGKVGFFKRENEDITKEIITSLLEKVISTIKNAGAICAVQCFEKCDWSVAIDAGADIISFDAYNNPSNLSIMPDKITEFLSRGGKINWAIIPSAPEAYIKSLKIDDIEKRLYATFSDLINSGVSAKLVYNSALVSSHENLSELPLIFAEKILMMSVQLAKKIPYIQ